MACPVRTTVSGADGFVNMTSYDAHCHAWSMDIVAETFDDTNWKDWSENPDDFGWRTFIPGIKGFSGSFECYADKVPDVDALPGQTVEVYFYVDYDARLGYRGCVVITAVHPAAAIDGLQSFNVDFQGTGKLTVGSIGVPTTTTT